MTTIYIDTEFSFPLFDADLLSVGAITEGGETYYVELTPLPKRISEFVRTHVLVHFESGNADCPRADFPARFEAWLKQWPDPRIIVDSAWDVLMLRKTVEGRLCATDGELKVGAVTTQIEIMPPVPDTERSRYNAARDAQLRTESRSHHALSDARVLRAGAMVRQDWR